MDMHLHFLQMAWMIFSKNKTFVANFDVVKEKFILAQLIFTIKSYHPSSINICYTFQTSRHCDRNELQKYQTWA